MTLVAKEIRALLPIWLTCVLIASATPFLHGGTHDFSVIAFVMATIAIGAYSIGHEYTHRTLGLMLTLPTDRRRLFFVKLAVVASMVLPLAAYASWLGVSVRTPELPWLIAAGTIGLVPVVTMICRDPLGSVMFTISSSTTLLAAVMIVRVGRWDPTPEMERAAFVTWTRLMFVASAAGAALAWPLFKRLEWIESGIEIAFPSLKTASRKAVPTRPLWQLVEKELRLQRLAFALAALYLVVAAADALFRTLRPLEVSFLAPVTQGYWLCVAVLAGSIASAEERQLGTLSWQLLLPTPAWQQWAVKVATVFGLAVLLGIGVPVLMLGHQLPNVRAITIQTLALSAAGLYASSLSNSAVMAGAASFGAIALFAWVVEPFTHLLRPAPHQPFGLGYDGSGALAFLAVAVVVLVRFAFVNHQTEDRRVRVGRL